MEIRKGKIMGFEGSFRSGLGLLMIRDSETGGMDRVPCDNGPTVRALESAFGNVIVGGHRVEAKGGHVGRTIYWSYDDLGLCLGGFIPAGEASAELREEYERGRVEWAI